MNKVITAKKIIRQLLIVLIVTFICIMIAFGVYVFGVNRYNQTARVVTPLSTSTDVMVDIHKRGQSTDSWEKNDAFPDKLLYGNIYEATIINNSGITVNDWEIRINIKEDCYINNAWNGTMEIHQYVEEDECVQEIDLRDYKEDELTVDYVIAGADLLIPLNKGDYIIYHPNDSKSYAEMPINSTSEYSGEISIGIIMYGFVDGNDLSDYEMSYHFHKSYFSGIEGKIFLILFPCWLIGMLIFIIVSGVVIKFENRFFVQGAMVKESLLLCAKVADSKDFYSKGHSKRVAEYSRMIAEQMGMDKSDCENVYNIALLHNIGNNLVPERIFKKPMKLSNEEYEMIKTHTTKGAELLENIKSIPHAAEGALYHHERYDGTGYPTGKKGDEIPLIGRIICVADAYEAMSHDRAYRRRMSMDQIKDELVKNKGTQFDPIIVGEFLQIIDDIEEDY